MKTLSRLLLVLFFCMTIFPFSSCVRGKKKCCEQPMIYVPSPDQMPVPPPPVRKFSPPPAAPKEIKHERKVAATPTPKAKKAEVVADKTVVMIDPGHGGEDYGTYSTTKPRYHEKYVNLTTAFLLKEYLEELGYAIILTRKDDTFIALDKRAEYANLREPDLFVSVHYNSAPSKEAEGVEVYYYQDTEDKKRTKESKQMAQAVLSRVIANTQAKSRGIKEGNFAVIRETKMPAILIEGGFLTNANELEKIKDPNYVKQLAWGIAEGIHEYMKK